MFRHKRWPIALLASTGALASCSSQSVPDALAQSDSGYIQSSNGVQLYFQTMGSGGDTIVVLHGGAMGFPLDYLAHDLEPLARTHTLIFYDQRGAGKSTIVSDSARIHLAAHVADVEAVRRHFGIERMTILGHSWGPGLAARYALQHPDNVSRLIMVGPMPIRNAPYNEQFAQNLIAWMDSTTLAELQTHFQAIQAIATAPDPHATCRGFWRIYLRGYFGDPQDTSTVQSMRGDLCDVSTEALRNSHVVRTLTMQSLGDWDWRNDFGDIRIPVLVIHGAREPIPVPSAREWEVAFPNARLVLIDGAGHYPHVERPQEFFAAVEEFLR